MFTLKKIHIAVLAACLTPTYAMATDLAPVEVNALIENAQETTTEATQLLQSGNSETGTTLHGPSYGLC